MVVQFSRSVVSDSLRPHELQHTRPPCPSPTPGVHPDSRPLSQWCHPAIHPLSSPSLRCSLNIGLMSDCSLGAQLVKNVPMQEAQEMWVWSLGWEDPLEKEMATHSSILARRILWTAEPGGLQSMGSQRVGYDWAHTHYPRHKIRWEAFKDSVLLKANFHNLKICKISLKTFHIDLEFPNNKGGKVCKGLY